MGDGSAFPRNASVQKFWNILNTCIPMFNCCKLTVFCYTVQQRMPGSLLTLPITIPADGLRIQVPGKGKTIYIVIKTAVSNMTWYNLSYTKSY